MTLPQIELKNDTISARGGNDIILDPSNGTLNLKGKVIVPAPLVDNNAATKLYVDQTATGLKVQPHVALATTIHDGDITLSGTQTIDGSGVVSDKRVLVKNQDDKDENGVYITNVGLWERANDFLPGTNISGYYVFVEGGN